MIHHQMMIHNPSINIKVIPVLLLLLLLFELLSAASIPSVLLRDALQPAPAPAPAPTSSLLLLLLLLLLSSS
jgi:hypothetical protein